MQEGRERRSIASRAHRIAAGLAFVAIATSAASGAEPAPGPPEARLPCAGRDPERRPFFGDLHVHTAFSQDASTQGTRTLPTDAYRFARGEPLGIQPFDADGHAQRTVRIDRPLDFAAVTDHAEQFGEVRICNTPGLAGHDSWVCRLYRTWPRVAFFWMNWVATSSETRHGFCGEDGERCLASAHGVWAEIRAAAEGAYDRTAACRFTSFVGYEWTASEGVGKNLHRNVVFRSAAVPELPVSVFEARTASALWDALQTGCVEGIDGCDFLAIPHNSNLSGELMFQSAVEVGGPIGPEEAARRSRFEPLIEVMQHKGDSECVPGGADELCAFETLPYDRFGAKFAPWIVGVKPPGHTTTVRFALGEGLRLGQRLGANPFRFGLLASTDTHLGTPGLTAEAGHPGHGGAARGAAEGLPQGLADDLEMSPGGLAVVWAEENTRASLFDAMRRREVYGTSGTRPVVRFFGGFDYDAALCGADAASLPAEGYANGVPMGGQLDAAQGRAPRFVVSARMDPGTDTAPGTPLERVQIVKGWLEDGQVRERVIDVAGGDREASVDLATCEPHGEGHASLCTVWEDPDFDPASPAFWYARVVENPTCRWSQYACNAAGVDCARPDSVPEAFADCCSESHRPVQRERAWTSPIWFDPDPPGSPGSDALTREPNAIDLEAATSSAAR